MPDRKAEIVQVIPGSESRAEQIDSGPDADEPSVGEWYWIKGEDPAGDDDPYLACVVHVGSNYVRVSGAGDRECVERIHLDSFWVRCTPERDPLLVVGREIEKRRQNVAYLLKQVNDIAQRLSITPSAALTDGSETQALALRGSSQPVDEYKAALARARDVELPELFKRIEAENSSLVRWISASLIPLRAQAEAVKPVVERVKDRIFSVELYAGLVESVEKVRDGDPAPFDAKIHIFQRRHYMDEECLANYRAGGMDFSGVSGFDAWLALEENFERILPFPRCVVAFQVRRFEKDRRWSNVAEFFRMQDEHRYDKMTFLYVRNGGQLFRLSTGIDFDRQLFPDMTKDQLDGRIYACISGDGRVEKIITEAQYLGMVEEEEREEREREAKYRAAPDEDKWRYQGHGIRESRWYHAFTPESVYYDDILKYMRSEMGRHNRLVLVLQGLLDRSPVLHPHPPWSLWDPDSFKAAVELVYDDSRALTPGDAPDFEEYRARLNASLKPGSITVGQEEAWERLEAIKENARLDADPRTRRSDYRHERYRPYGNPGPGTLARVYAVRPKDGKVVYAWSRERRTSRGLDDDGSREVRCTFTCSAREVLNVDAYKPGDFKVFLSDPRTRARYLEWAPLLLEAEEYHAGNRMVANIPPAPKPKKPTREGRQRYANRKRQKELLGKAVRLTRDIQMRQPGLVYREGTLWRVTGGKGSTVCVVGINDDGTYDKQGSRRINNLDFDDVRVDPGIPVLPREGERARRTDLDGGSGEDDG